MPHRACLGFVLYLTKQSEHALTDLHRTIEATFDAALSDLGGHQPFAKEAEEGEQKQVYDAADTFREPPDTDAMLKGFKRLLNNIQWQYPIPSEKNTPREKAHNALSALHKKIYTSLLEIGRNQRTIPVTQLIRDLELKSTHPEDKRDPEVSAHEEGSEEVAAQLLSLRGQDRLVHVGFSSTHNFDIMCLTRPEFGLICDSRSENSVFIKAILEKLQIKPELTRKAFIEAMAEWIGGDDTAPYFDEDARGDADEEFRKSAEKANSWLNTDDNFEFIRKLAREGKLGVLTVGVADTEVFASIKETLHQQGFRIGSLYLGTLRGNMKTPNQQHSYNDAVRALSDENTYIIDAQRPEGAEEHSLPKQRLVRAAEDAMIEVEITEPAAAVVLDEGSESETEV